MKNVVTSYQINYTCTAQASTSAEINTSAVDTAGCDSILFISSQSAARIVKLQGGATSTSATTDITGASVTCTAGAATKIEVFNPQYRWIRQTTVTGAASIQGDCYTLLRPRSVPVSNAAAVVISTTTD